MSAFAFIFCQKELIVCVAQFAEAIESSSPTLEFGKDGSCKKKGEQPRV